MIHETTCDLLVRHGECSCRSEDDYGKRAHLAASAHLIACWEAMDAGEAGEPVDSPASAPFCGCDDCEVREILYAAFPILEAGIRGS